MRITMKEKLKMCDEHLNKGISLSHLSEQYHNYPVASIKYLVKLYRKHGPKPFFERDKREVSSIAQEESRSLSQNVTWGIRKAFSDGKVRNRL